MSTSNDGRVAPKYNVGHRKHPRQTAPNDPSPDREREFEGLYQRWIDANGSRSPSIRTAMKWLYDANPATPTESEGVKAMREIVDDILNKHTILLMGDLNGLLDKIKAMKKILDKERAGGV